MAILDKWCTLNNMAINPSKLYADNWHTKKTDWIVPICSRYHFTITLDTCVIRSPFRQESDLENPY